MSNTVYFGSATQRELRWEETLPAKLDRVLERLQLRERVKGETVAIKMHLGGNVGYSTIHPVFVRKVVQAVKQGGGTPFVTDTPGAVLSAHERGYTSETLGCPILPVAGINDTYYRVTEEPYKNIREWKTAGQVADATFLVDFAHAKGHPTCGYGGVFKNLALGCQVGAVRSQMHDVCHFDRYWFADQCPDAAVRQRLIESCPRKALVPDKHDPRELHLHIEPCNACGRCLAIAPPGALKIQAVNFTSFQEACALAVKQTLRTFAPTKQVFLNLATYITPVCDCFGMTTMPVLPDVGLFGGNDICAVEQATLDAIGRCELLEQYLPSASFEVQRQQPHPFQQIHGPFKDPYLVIRYAEKLGLGNSKHSVVDVMEAAPVTGPAEVVSAAKL